MKTTIETIDKAVEKINERQHELLVMAANNAKTVLDTWTSTINMKNLTYRVRPEFSYAYGGFIPFEIIINTNEYIRVTSNSIWNPECEPHIEVNMRNRYTDNPETGDAMINNLAVVSSFAQVLYKNKTQIIQDIVTVIGSAKREYDKIEIEKNELKVERARLHREAADNETAKLLNTLQTTGINFEGARRFDFGYGKHRSVWDPKHIKVTKVSKSGLTVTMEVQIPNLYLGGHETLTFDKVNTDALIHFVKQNLKETVA